MCVLQLYIGSKHNFVLCIHKHTYRVTCMCTRMSTHTHTCTNAHTCTQLNYITFMFNCSHIMVINTFFNKLSSSSQLQHQKDNRVPAKSAGTRYKMMQEIMPQFCFQNTNCCTKYVCVHAIVSVVVEEVCQIVNAFFISLFHVFSVSNSL